MRLGSALDQNEQLDNELVGHLARQALLKSPATSPRRSQTAIEVNSFVSVYIFVWKAGAISCIAAFLCHSP